jgi:RNA polymerase sigma factor (sigma-70 family)
MSDRETTPLAKVFATLRLRPRRVADAANRFARLLGISEGISRQHLLRIRNGTAHATDSKIFIIVAAIRELTGFAVRAADLFHLEPALADGTPYVNPISSGHPRGLNLPQSTPPTNETEFEALYLEYGVLLRTIAIRRYRVPPDEAEALVHDTFIAYLERHTVIRELKPWLMGAVGNSCKHYWRDRKREAPMPEGVEETPAGGDAADEWAWRISVGAAVARLGEKCRETLRGYYWRDESNELIAARLATSPGYVRQLLVSCRRRVKELLQGTRRGSDEPPR